MTTHTNIKSWNEFWGEIKSGPSGGQATSKIGRRLDGTIECGFIKILTEQGQNERRQRFYREAAALEILDNDGIPKLIETNARNFGDKSYNLYLVSAYIPGKTLQELSVDAYTPQQAINWVVTLCNILQSCRVAGILHRDIKPQNCILGNDGKFYLVDFGISSNTNEPDGFETSIGQELGNRFLRLPELHAGSANKDDPRSDITQVVGILFFLLTKKYPRALQDDQECFPHQRTDVAALLRKLEIPRPDRLIRIFDQGFQHGIDKRWQSAEALRDTLLSCLEPNNSGADADSIQQKILEKAQSAPAMQAKNIRNKLESIKNQIEALRNKMVDDLLGEVISSSGFMPRINISEATLSFDTGFLYTASNQPIFLGFLIQHLGTEFIVSVYYNQLLQAEIRVPVCPGEFTTDGLDKIREIYLRKISTHAIIEQV